MMFRDEIRFERVAKVAGERGQLNDKQVGETYETKVSLRPRSTGAAKVWEKRQGGRLTTR